MFASEKVMLDYLSQLLIEEDDEPKHEPVLASESIVEISSPVITGSSYEPTVKLNPIKSSISELKPYKEKEAAKVHTLPETDSVAKLLQQVSVKQQEEKIVKEQVKVVDEVSTEVQVHQKTVEAPTQVEQKVEDVLPQEPFQALFFDVAGLQLAVPLQELGGIHNLTEVSSLLGKPDWFHGVMLNREQKINVVDSARWVMPEKYNQNLEQQINYQYVIMLGESSWGLTAETLIETELIQIDAVKWRKGPGKRPWLFGTIKEKMCALLHVSDLIAMLEQGINARQE